MQEHSAEPFIDARSFLDWWLACWLLGNSDAHAKNLALVYRPRLAGTGQALRLAPFYDLVCTRAYPGLDARLATRIGGEATPGQVGTAALQRATQELGLRRGFLVERARTLAREVPAAVERVLARVREERRSRGVHQRIARVATTQARRALTLLG